MHLSRKKKYLQIAFNRPLEESCRMVADLPVSENIIIEAGTPLIKKYGTYGISRIASAWRNKSGPDGYVVADLKCMDRGSTEVNAAAQAGASAATCLGLAPVETINSFIKSCFEAGIDSMVDMMNVEFPFEVLGKLVKPPVAVVIHLGVDERSNRDKALEYHEISRIKGAYNIMISVAGGETLRDASRTYFNGADIAVVWEEFFNDPTRSSELAEKFLSAIKR